MHGKGLVCGRRRRRKHRPIFFVVSWFEFLYVCPERGRARSPRPSMAPRRDGSMARHGVMVPQGSAPRRLPPVSWTKPMLLRNQRKKSYAPAVRGTFSLHVGCPVCCCVLRQGPPVPEDHFILGPPVSWLGQTGPVGSGKGMGGRGGSVIHMNLLRVP